MNYYYDILLNFQDKYYMFYEWDKNDNIEFIKKIPLFHLKEKDYKNLYINIIKINKEFLKTIENKTKLKNGYLKYTAIFSDGKNSIGLEFNDDGLVINKSSILLDDEININEFMYNIEVSNISYEIISKESFDKETRQELNVKKLIKMELNNIIEKKEYSKLKYIYLEWFNEFNNNYSKMYEKMIDKLNDNLTEKEYQIYELIKITYNV